MFVSSAKFMRPSCLFHRIVWRIKKDHANKTHITELASEKTLLTISWSLPIRISSSDILPPVSWHHLCQTPLLLLLQTLPKFLFSPAVRVSVTSHEHSRIHCDVSCFQGIRIAERSWRHWSSLTRDTHSPLGLAQSTQALLLTRSEADLQWQMRHEIWYHPIIYGLEYESRQLLLKLCAADKYCKTGWCCSSPVSSIIFPAT